MIICDECRTNNRNESRYCRGCGQPIQSTRSHKEWASDLVGTSKGKRTRWATDLIGF
ncbi:hypothetical protein GF345_03775 [Candidatus Woesearchaeota archaeon]|nr:hypothetical protein [Candidatus Woesearchaeota archaeon]